MKYYEAALQVLKSAPHPLSVEEITDQAIQKRLIAPTGKTPYATMRASLYGRLQVDPELVKLHEWGRVRAKQGSVRWALRDPETTERN
jgi:hypothetical protein